MAKEKKSSLQDEKNDTQAGTVKTTVTLSQRKNSKGKEQEEKNFILRSYERAQNDHLFGTITAAFFTLILCLLLLLCILPQGSFFITYDSLNNTQKIIVEKGFNARLDERAPITEWTNSEWYVFSGWYYNVDTSEKPQNWPEENKWDFTQNTVSYNLTLYARWLPVDIHIKLITDPNGEPIIESTNIEDDFKYVAPEGENAPTREGYTFAGWYRDPEFTIEYQEGERYKEETVLYAKWNINSYTITIDKDGANEDCPPSLTFEYGETISGLPETMTKEGYRFKGWLGRIEGYVPDPDADPDLVNDGFVVFNFKTMPAGNYDVKPFWEIINYYIYFNNSDGSYYSKAPSNIANGYRPEMVEAPKIIGYECIGWFYKNDQSREFTFQQVNGKWVSAIEIKEDNDNLNLIPKYEKGSYTITFDTAGGDPIESLRNKEYQEYIGPLPAARGRDGYQFDYWYYIDENGKEIEFKDTVMPGMDMTLIAKWKTVDYEAVFVVDDQTSFSRFTDITKNYKFSEPPRPEKKGYTFDAWYTDLNDLSTKWVFGGNTADISKDPARNVVLFANWKKNTYKVSFIGNDGIFQETSSKSPLVRQVEFLDAIDPVLSSEISRKGYQFIGWYADIALMQKFDFDSQTMPAENINLYAKWTAIPVKVEFYGSDGKKYLGSALTDIGRNYIVTPIANPAAPNGFDFSGWTTVPDSITDLWDPKNPVPQEYIDLGTMKVYALFEDAGSNAKRTVTFKSNLTEETLAQFEVPKNTVIPSEKYPDISSIQVGAEYTFSGWFDAKVDGTKWDVNAVVGNHITIWGVWEIQTFDITYDANGGTFSDGSGNLVQQDIAYGDKLLLPEVPTHPEGCAFLGWYTDATFSTAWDFNNDTVTTTFTLYAKWDTAKISVTFYGNGGIFDNDRTKDRITKEVEVGGKVDALPSAPQKEKFKFVGWFYDTDGLLPYDIDDVLDESNTHVTDGTLSIYAKWVAIYEVTFLSNGGYFKGTTLTEKKVEVEMGKTVTLFTESDITAPTNKKLSGWFLDSNASFAFDPSTLIMNDVTLYAGYIPLETFIVTFMPNGGTFNSGNPYEDVTVVENTKLISTPKIIAPKGKTLAYWAVGSEFGTKFDFASTPITENFTVYAVWKDDDSFNFVWSDQYAGYVLTGYRGNEEFLTIPSTFNGKNVVGIQGNASNSPFGNATSVVFPNTIEYLSEYAFTKTKLKNIDLSNTKIREIPARVCENMTQLETFKMPASVTKIGVNAFNGCVMLSNLEMGESVTSIGQNAFKGCTSLTEIDLKNASQLGVSAFDGCSNLSIIKADKVQTLMDNALKGTKITSISLPASTVVGSRVFENCTELTTVTFGSYLNALGEYVFKNCPKLVSIEIPRVITSTTCHSSTFQYMEIGRAHV